MKVTREEMRAEAIKRLEYLTKKGLYKSVLADFKEGKLVNISEPPFGGLYWADEKTTELIENLEKERGYLVYFGIKSFTEFGELTSLFFVYEDNEDWAYDWEDLKENITVAYVKNWTYDDCSEAGSIGFRIVETSGGALRTS